MWSFFLLGKSAVGRVAKSTPQEPKRKSQVVSTNCKLTGRHRFYNTPSPRATSILQHAATASDELEGLTPGLARTLFRGD
eukprot:3319683-Prymnesium_polylepis.1